VKARRLVETNLRAFLMWLQVLLAVYDESDGLRLLSEVT
jgi:hypothetical protein